ncbi:hypothetical protein R1sor_027041 [Riccia sorocarpa]|uniref:Uncharacterized protein n=1 Tax=Riccia sorocarpa TaxID=122646 RepID=A0ABD3GDT2_9MARC
MLAFLYPNQRIALHWMEERETKNGTPFGGILADDQARAPIWNQEAGSPPCVDGEGLLTGGTLVVCPTMTFDILTYPRPIFHPQFCCYNNWLEIYNNWLEI